MNKITLRALLLSAVILASTVNCGPPSSMLATGSDLLMAVTKNPLLTKFAGLLKTPGLGPFLDSVLKGKFTMLAPTDDALKSMGEDVLTKMTDPTKLGDLANVLKNHIIPGKKDASDLKEGGLKSASGKPLNLSGVNLGSMTSDKKFNLIPIDKVLK